MFEISLLFPLLPSTSAAAHPCTIPIPLPIASRCRPATSRYHASDRRPETRKAYVLVVRLVSCSLRRRRPAIRPEWPPVCVLTRRSKTSSHLCSSPTGATLCHWQQDFSSQHLNLPGRTSHPLGCQLASIFSLEHAILRPQYHLYVAGQARRYGFSVYTHIHTCLRTCRLTTTVQKPVKSAK